MNVGTTFLVIVRFSIHSSLCLSVSLLLVCSDDRLFLLFGIQQLCRTQTGDWRTIADWKRVESYKHNWTFLFSFEKYRVSSCNAQSCISGVSAVANKSLTALFTFGATNWKANHQMAVAVESIKRRRKHI